MISEGSFHGIHCEKEHCLFLHHENVGQGHALSCDGHIKRSIITKIGGERITNSTIILARCPFGDVLMENLITF